MRGVTRRFLLLAGTALALVPAVRAAPTGAAQAPIMQPKRREPQIYIARAFALRDEAIAFGDQPYGALVVKDGLVIGEAPSRVIVKGDWSAHAEREALRDAARRAGAAAVAGATLYSSSHPCPACEAAAHKAGIATMIFGEDATDAGAPQARDG